MLEIRVMEFPYLRIIDPKVFFKDFTAVSIITWIHLDRYGLINDKPVCLNEAKKALMKAERYDLLAAITNFLSINNICLN